MRCRTCVKLGVLALLIAALAGWSLEPAAGQMRSDPKSSPRMSPSEFQSFVALTTDAREGAVHPLATTPKGSTMYAVLHAEFTSAAACRDFKPPEGVTVFHRFGKFADLFADPTRKESLEELQNTPQIRWMDFGQLVKVPPPPREKDTGEKPRDMPEPIVHGGMAGLTGKGVVIAILDTGLDFRHKDFITTGEDGKPVSRLLWFWDTLTQPPGGDKPGRKGPYSYPNGAPIGVLYSHEELTAELQERKGQIPVTDTHGHGTACAGVAAGNGTALPGKKYAGVAPEADLIAVRLGPGPGVDNMYLLNAVCSWLDKVCGDRPLVVSCSFGGMHGGHDGFRVPERQLDEQFPLSARHRAICIAAGNNADLPAHARVEFQGSKARGTLAFAASGTGALAVFIDTEELDDVVAKVIGYPDAKMQRYLHPLSGSVVLEILFSPQTAGEPLGGELELFSKSGKALEAHAYIQGFGFIGFIGHARSRTCLINTPGTTTNAITVGSYDFNDRFDAVGRPATLGTNGKPLRLGAISGYSSPGYSRQGKVIKPDITAPGQFHIAPAARSVSLLSLDTSGKYMAFNGTSAATPYTAGVVALMMERQPDLTLGRIKELLRKHARQDEFTGPTPNPQWGYGKLNYEAVEAILKSLGKSE